LTDLSGHVKILEKLSEIKQSSGGLLSTVLATFDPHPRQVLGRILANELICSLLDKIKLLSGHNLDAFVKSRGTAFSVIPMKTGIQ